jgi:uncharacterized repeat protein (TIGR03803 family)
MHHALLGMAVLLAILLPFGARAGAEFQLFQSLGKQEGNPYGKLVQDASGNLYGTTYYSGGKSAGTVFKIDTSGNFSMLYHFDYIDGDAHSPQGG